MKTKDFDIRSCLHSNLVKEYSNDPDTIVIDELGLCQGIARVDIAVVNGALHGYEIKSESDTLDRLPGQVSIYSKVLDTVTIVTGRNHLQNIEKMVPGWWGIDIAENSEDRGVIIDSFRAYFKNPSTDPYSIVQLLWREEALNLLQRFDLDNGMYSKPRKKIWGKLAESLPIDDLKYHVRELIKARGSWRSGLLQMLNGD